ncbi:MAG TPA: ABC transporter substrate-binding protein [Thermomicrobiales bacterium]|jgi:peptide/nickel transport system substrate-binding protein
MKRLLLVLVLLALTAVPLGTRVHAQSNGVLRAGLDVDAGTGDPRLMNDTSAFRMSELVFDGLVVLDQTLVPQPALATSWDNPDPTTWVFHLRQGVKFHDGSDLTADDVVYTFQSILDPNFAAPFRTLYAPITSVTATDPQTVTFKLSEAYAPFLSYMDMAIVPKHIASDASKDFANHPVGTGAFKFVSWERNSKIELTANPDYWGGAPKLAGVTLFIIPDNTVRATALETGDLDLIHSPLSPQDVAHLKGVDGVTVSEQTALGYTYLNFNTKDPILSDVKVRQALAHLVDKKTISQEIYQGMDKPGKSPLVPGTWWYADVPDQAYDPAAAAQLLTEAGWAKNADGIYEKDGKKLTIVLKTHSEDPNRIQVVEYLQNVFKENGIDASVVTTEWPTYIAAVQKADYQIALIGWLRLIDPDYAMFDQFRCGGGLNWGGYCDPAIDEALKEGRASSDQAKRAEAYQQVAKTVVDQVVYDVLLYQGYIVVTRNNVSGFVPNPSGSWKSLLVTSLS